MNRATMPGLLEAHMLVRLLAARAIYVEERLTEEQLADLMDGRHAERGEEQLTTMGALVRRTASHLGLEPTTLGHMSENDLRQVGAWLARVCLDQPEYGDPATPRGARYDWRQAAEYLVGSKQ